MIELGSEYNDQEEESERKQKGAKRQPTGKTEPKGGPPREPEGARGNKTLRGQMKLEQSTS